MNNSNIWKFDWFLGEEAKGREIARQARKNIEALLKQVAREENGIEIGNIVKGSSRGDKMSVTHFELMWVEDNCFVGVHGLPLNKKGEPMERREPVFIGPAEVLKRLDKHLL